jgi:hypothetical protein
MDTYDILDTVVHTPFHEQYLLGYTQTPLTRIGCKTRKFTPTICDGTCRDCKLERLADMKRRKTSTIYQDISFDPLD